MISPNPALFPFHKSVRIIKELSGLLAIHKPCGILSHPNCPTDASNSLLSCPYYLQKEVYSPGEGNVSLYLLNRLDNATSGLLLMSKDASLADEVKKLFLKREVNKKYLALVFGASRSLPLNRPILWRDEITSKGKKCVAETEVKVKAIFPKKFPATCLLELSPKTGFTHQLRIQCARRGLPIVGDVTYGDFELNKELLRNVENLPVRMFLHSNSVSFTLNRENGSPIVFEAEDPAPPEFYQLT